MSSAMSIGAGRAGCMYNALNGAILALGMFFGHTTFTLCIDHNPHEIDHADPPQ